MKAGQVTSFKDKHSYKLKGKGNSDNPLLVVIGENDKALLVIGYSETAKKGSKLKAFRKSEIYDNDAHKIITFSINFPGHS